jgi:hypothetical protein
MEISSWIFLKDGKPAFIQTSPSQNDWLIDTAPAQCAKAGDVYFVRLLSIMQFNKVNPFLSDTVEWDEVVDDLQWS